MDEQEYAKIRTIITEFLIPAIRGELQNEVNRINDIKKSVDEKLEHFFGKNTNLESQIEKLKETVKDLQKGIGKELLDMAKKK